MSERHPLALTHSSSHRGAVCLGMSLQRRNFWVDFKLMSQGCGKTPKFTIHACIPQMVFDISMTGTGLGQPIRSYSAPAQSNGCSDTSWKELWSEKVQQGPAGDHTTLEHMGTAMSLPLLCN